MITVLDAKLTLLKLPLSRMANITLTDEHNDTLLHLVCQGKNYSIVKYLMLNFDINASWRHCGISAMNAASAGKKVALNPLLSENDYVPLFDDSLDIVLLPLWNVCYRFVTKSNGNKHGWTPVMVVAREGQKDVFNLLLRQKTDFTFIDDHQDNVHV